MSVTERRKDELQRAPAIDHMEGAVLPITSGLAPLHSPLGQEHGFSFHRSFELNFCLDA